MWKLFYLSKKMGVRDITKVAAIKGIQIGQKLFFGII